MCLQHPFSTCLVLFFLKKKKKRDIWWRLMYTRLTHPALMLPSPQRISFRYGYLPIQFTLNSRFVLVSSRPLLISVNTIIFINSANYSIHSVSIILVKRRFHYLLKKTKPKWSKFTSVNQTGWARSFGKNDVTLGSRERALRASSSIK